MEILIIVAGALAYYAAYKFVVYLADKSPMEEGGVIHCIPTQRRMPRARIIFALVVLALMSGWWLQ